MNEKPGLDGRAIGGILLALAGLLLLLQNLNLIGVLMPVSWSLFFWAGGVLFLVQYRRDPANQWFLIPAMVLVAVGTVIALNHLIPGVRLVGTLALSLVSAGFWGVFILHRQQWWAIIPGGVTGTLAIEAILDGLLPWFPTGGLFFYGVATTFGLVYLWGEPKATVMWALIPAGVLAVIGTIVTLFTSMHLLLWIGIILLGIHQLRKSKRDRE